MYYANWRNFYDTMMEYDLDDNPAIMKAWRYLIAQYERPYHNLEHIDKMLSDLETSHYEPEDKRSLILAIFFHDVIYDLTPHCENRSAKAMKEYLDVLLFDYGTDMLADLIESTDHEDDCYLTNDELAIRCLDLMSLAGHLNEFKVRTSRVNEEAKMLGATEEEIIIGTKDFAEKMLAKPMLFPFHPFHQHEDQARHNLKWLLN